jgi:hypothetical protein
MRSLESSLFLSASFNLFRVREIDQIVDPPTPFFFLLSLTSALLKPPVFEIFRNGEVSYRYRRLVCLHFASHVI